MTTNAEDDAKHKMGSCLTIECRICQDWFNPKGISSRKIGGVVAFSSRVLTNMIFPYPIYELRETSLTKKLENKK